MAAQELGWAAASITFAAHKIAIPNRKIFSWILLSPTLVIVAYLGLFPFVYAIRTAVLNNRFYKVKWPMEFLIWSVILLITMDLLWLRFFLPE